MTSLKDIKVYNAESSSNVPLGAVRVNGAATYNMVRKEIIEDELFEEPFNFVLDDSIAINAKQEEKWLVENGPVYLKRKTNVHDLNPTSSKIPCRLGSSLRGEQECSLTHKAVSSQGSTLEEISLVSKEELDQWEKECERARAKLKTMVVPRYDDFELKVENLNGKGVIQLWCNECGEAYGSGSSDGKFTAYTCLSNFLRTHIYSKKHEKKYNSKRDLAGDLAHTNKKEAIRQDDASCIHHALEVMKTFNDTNGKTKLFSHSLMVQHFYVFVSFYILLFHTRHVF